MATYIQGLTDYIPQIQPFQPDYNFLSNVLQTRQSKYDANYNQLSSVYTSLLNSPMSRPDDIKRKDEFFKNIDQNIKKVSGMDLSLQQNVDVAMKVFQPFYDDKSLVNDMVKTKQGQNAMAAHERYKNCIDTAKCGGEAWDEGLQEVQYKMDEFSKTTDEEALGFNMPEYTPYYNWKKEAIKLAKEQDFNVTQESVNGPWIVKDTNGNLVKGGLYSLYKNTYGKDARVSANYKTEAYVQRKNTVASTIGQFGSEEAAERNYLNNMISSSGKRVEKMYNEFNNISTAMGEQTTALTKKAEGNGITPDEEDTLQSLFQKKEAIDYTTSQLEETHNAIHNNADNTELVALRFRGDAAAAFENEQRDMMDFAGTMSRRGMSHTIDANPYALATHSSDLALRNAMTTAQYARETGLINISAKHAADIDQWNLEHGVTSGAIPVGPSGVVLPNVDGNTDMSNLDKPSAGYDANISTQKQFEGASKQSAADVLYSLFVAAKDESKTSTTANTYLKSIGGDAWPLIKSKDDLVNYFAKNKKSITDVFNTNMSELDAVKNKDSNVSWATPIMTDRAADIQTAQVNQMANEITSEHTASINKEVVDSLQGQRSVNPLFYNANLLLDNAGFLVSKEEFKAKYDAQYAGKKAGNADDVYDVVSSEFFKTFDKKPGALLLTNGNLPGNNKGASGDYADVISYQELSSNKPQDTGLLFTTSIISDLVTDGNYKVTPGGISQDEISKNGSDALKSFIPKLLYDLKSGNKGKDRPVVTINNAPIAGGDKNTSALTINFLNDEYFKSFFGTKENPTKLAAFKNDLLNNGITLSYNNNEVSTATTKAKLADPLITTAKLKEIEFTAFPKGGYAKSSYDASTGLFTVQRSRMTYDPTTFRAISVPEKNTRITAEQYRVWYNETMGLLNSQQQANMDFEVNVLAPANKKKQLTPQ